jgi:hypothetical protein
MYYPISQAKYIAPAVLDKVRTEHGYTGTQASLYIVEVVCRVWIRAIPSSAPTKAKRKNSTNNHCEIVLQESNNVDSYCAHPVQPSGDYSLSWRIIPSSPETISTCVSPLCPKLREEDDSLCLSLCR